MNIAMFLAKLGRRFCWNLDSRHHSVKYYQMFQRILSGEDVWKGQIISQENFGVIKSSKDPSKFFLTDFCPSFIGQKSVKKLVGCLGDLKTPTFHSEIN